MDPTQSMKTSLANHHDHPGLYCPARLHLDKILLVCAKKCAPNAILAENLAILATYCKLNESVGENFENHNDERPNALSIADSGGCFTTIEPRVYNNT